MTHWPERCELCPFYGGAEAAVVPSRVIDARSTLGAACDTVRLSCARERANISPDEKPLTEIGLPAVSGDSPEPAGACFLDVLWQRIDIGFIGLDCASERVVRINQYAKELLVSHTQPVEFGHLVKLFMSGTPAIREATVDSNPEALTLGRQIIGYTVHGISDHLAVILLRDITQRKRLEGIAEAANLMENIGYIFAGIRHELGNPVNSLKMTLSVLRRQLGDLQPGAVVEYTERAIAELTRIECLLASLRSFTMYESVDTAPIQLLPSLHRFLDMAKKDLGTRGVRVSLEASDDDLWILANERALQQVLLNLLTNSLDALAGFESPRIDIVARLRGDSLVELSFRDNGAGMGARELNDAFKPFFTSKASGTGLGLAIVRRMLSAMGGQIVLSSQPGAGTEATVTLPRLDAPPSPSLPSQEPQ